MEAGKKEGIHQATDILGPRPDRYAGALAAGDQLFDEGQIAGECLAAYWIYLSEAGWVKIITSLLKEDQSSGITITVYRRGVLSCPTPYITELNNLFNASRAIQSAIETSHKNSLEFIVF